MPTPCRRLRSSWLGQTLESRVLILLTDGRDVRSLASWDEAVRAAKRRRSSSTRSPSAMRSGPAGAPRPGDRRHRLPEPDPAALANVYRRIGAELDRTWQMSYTTAARPGERSPSRWARENGHGLTVTLPGRAQGARRRLAAGLARSTAPAAACCCSSSRSHPSSSWPSARRRPPARGACQAPRAGAHRPRGTPSGEGSKRRRPTIAVFLAGARPAPPWPAPVRARGAAGRDRRRSRLGYDGRRRRDPPVDPAAHPRSDGRSGVAFVVLILFAGRAGRPVRRSSTTSGRDVSARSRTSFRTCSARSRRRSGSATA